MIDLAENNKNGYIPLKDIAERQGISKKYLEIIAKELTVGKLIEGVSGKGGGYKLSRDPGEYSVGEIIELMEGSIAPVSCVGKGADKCPHASECRTLPMWTEYDNMIHDFFYGKKLTDLLKR